MIRFTIILLLLVSCARKEALTGGEEDKISPYIAQSIPKSDSTRIGDLKEFTFEFSERVDRKSFEEHFYTIPFLKYKPIFVWDKWDKVTVQIEDTLSEDLTYLIKIGKGFTDLHRYPSDREYQYAITKSEKLDSLQYSGTIFSVDKSKQLKFALYDIINFKEFPNYVVDIDDNNRFSFKYLKGGKYVPVVFEDLNKNHVPDIASEKLSFLTDSIHLSKSIHESHYIQLFKSDTLPASIEKIDTLGKNVLEITFDRNVNLNKSHIFLEDTSKVKYPLTFIGDSITKSIIAYHKSLNDKLHYVKYDKLVNTKGIRSDTMTYDIEYYQSTGIDTNQFSLSLMNISDSVELNVLKPEIKLTFNQNFLWDNSDSIYFKQKNKFIKHKVTQEKLNQLTLSFDKELKSSTEYQLHFSLKKQMSFEGKTIKDTSNVLSFFTPSSENYGSIIFDVKSKHSELFVEVYSASSNKKYVVKKRFDTSKEQTIKNLEGGNYLLRFFLDKNGNSKYDLGSVSPFRFAEPIYFYNDTIHVRKRWDSKESTINIGF